MTCPVCFDEGRGDVDLEHKTGSQHFHDPTAYDGHGERETCWLECPTCGYGTDCDGDCKLPPEE